MNPMSVQEIEVSRPKLLSNAESLYSEAVLLVENGHYARAYTLAHLCGEELAKIPMLVCAGLQLVDGHPVDWEKLGKRMRSHTEKIRGNHAHDYFRAEVRADDSDLRAYETALETTEDLNRLKNASLYAEQEGSVFLSPSERFGKTEAEQALRYASNLLAYIRQGEAATHGKIAASKSAAKLVGTLKRGEI
jgi:AbiV family abortive infection protein